MIVFIVPFMALAAIGFLLSLVVHLLALSGHLPPGGEAVFALHVGIFAVWLPAVFVVIRSNKGQQTRFSWIQVLAGCPSWMRYLAAALFAYACVNFFLVFGTQPAQHSQRSNLSPEILRGFSGHWMLFYGIAFCVLFSVFRKPWLLGAAKCPAGHSVAHSDVFCPTCGLAIPARSERS